MDLGVPALIRQMRRNSQDGGRTAVTLLPIGPLLTLYVLALVGYLSILALCFRQLLDDSLVVLRATTFFPDSGSVLPTGIRLLRCFSGSRPLILASANRDKLGIQLKVSTSVLLRQLSYVLPECHSGSCEMARRCNVRARRRKARR